MSQTATRKDAIVACIEKNLAAAPPLTEDQLDRLAGMLRPFAGLQAPIPKADPDQQLQAAICAINRKKERALTQCAICSTPKAGHYLNNRWHAWEQIDAKDYARIQRKYDDQIAALKSKENTDG